MLVPSLVLAAELVWAAADPLEVRHLVPAPGGQPTIRQSARDLPVIGAADVVVAGGGLQGVEAALRAANDGLSVILIEERNSLGYDPAKPKASLNQRVAAQPRITVYLLSMPQGVLLQGDRACGVVMVNRSGRQVVLAKAVVDATAEGRLAKAAGDQAMLCCGQQAGRRAVETVKAQKDLPRLPSCPPLGQMPAGPQVRELLAGIDPALKYPVVREEAVDLPVCREVGVLVVGGGTSGAYAAIAAARQGARVALVEVLPRLGGTSSHRVTCYYWGVPFKSRLSEEVDSRIDLRKREGPTSAEKVAFSG